MTGEREKDWESNMNMYIILYLLILQNVSSEPVYSREELYEVTDYNPDRFYLDLSSEIQGNITIKWSSSPSFNIYIQISTEDIKSQDPVQIQKNFTLESLQLRILKKILEDRVSSPSSLNANRGLATAGSVLLTFWAIILTHGWKVALFYGVLILSLFIFVEGSLARHTRCDVVVECPRNISISGMKLFVDDGNITVDRELLQATNTTPECVTSYSVLSKKGCSSCCYGDGVCGPGNICKCFKDSEEENCRKRNTPQYKLFVNPGDSRITEMQLPNDESLTIHGRKRHDGNIRSLDTFKSRNQNGNDVTIFLSGKRRIGKILSDTGSTITFDWKDKCVAHVTAITSNSQGQVNIEVNTCANIYDLFPYDPSWGNSAYTSFISSATEKCSRNYREIRSTDRHSEIPVKSKSKSKYFVPVKVTRCGSPISSVTVYARVKTRESNQSRVSEYIGKPTKHAGIFHIQIPTHFVSHDVDILQKSCTSFNSTVKRTCKKVLSKFSCDKIKFCSSIKRAFSFVKSVTPSQTNDVIITCEKAFDTVLSFCTKVTSVLDLQKGTSCIANNILIEESYIPGPILFSPYAVLPNGHRIESSYIEINPVSSKKYNTEIILTDTRPNPTISGFSITPEDPKPLQRYEVKVNYSCASNATTIDMKILGSDKYTNYATCYGITSCNCCVLHVAGAAASVKDIVTVTVTDSLVNLNFTREFVVIF